MSQRELTLSRPWVTVTTERRITVVERAMVNKPIVPLTVRTSQKERGNDSFGKEWMEEGY